MKVLSIVFCFVISFFHLTAQPKIGTVAPEINLKDKGGNNISLTSLRGKVVLVDFWASWCRPCRNSNQLILPIYNRYKEKGFEVYGISLDQDTTAWQKAIKTDQITWLQFNEKGGWDTSTADAWKIDMLPTSFLIDKRGVIISVDPTEKELRKYLQLALQ